MFSSSLGTALVGAVLATNVAAYPPAYAPEKYSDRIDVVHTGISTVVHSGVSARHASHKQLCSHDISCSRQNEVLLDTGVSAALDVFGLLDLGLGADIGISFGSASGCQIKCVDCRTWGTAVVTNTVAEISGNIIEEVLEFLEHPYETIVEAASLECLISLEDVGGHIELNVFAAESATYTLNIFEAGLIADISILDTVSVGLNVFLDLVISVDAQVDLSAGFEFSFPEGASLTVDLLAGAIKDYNFDGAVMNELPIVVLAGEATLQASIRCRVEAGTTVSLLGIGYGFELGVYADLLQYVTEIGSTDDCPLSISGAVDVNIGAYAASVAKIDFAAFEIAPTAAITVNAGALAAICTTRPTSTRGLGAISTGSASSGSDSTGSGSSGSASSGSGSDGLGGSISIGLGGSGSIGLGGSGSDSGASASDSGSAPSGTGHFSNSTALTASRSSGASATGSLIGTITSAASLTTSTVYATQVTTITSCASNVIHCPASLAGTTVVTQTVIDYTTVCPVTEAGNTASGAVPSSLPSLTTSANTHVAPSSIPGTVILTSVASASPSTFDVPSSTPIAVVPVGTGASTTNLASITSALSSELSGSSPSSAIGSGSNTASAPTPSGTGELSGETTSPSGSSPSASGSGTSGSGSYPSGSPSGSGSSPSASGSNGSSPSASGPNGSSPSASGSENGSSPSGSAAASVPCVSSGALLSGQTACPVSGSTPAQTSTGELSGLSTAPAGSSPSSVATGSSPSASNGAYPSGSSPNASSGSNQPSASGSLPAVSSKGSSPSESANISSTSGTTDSSGASVTGGSSPSASSSETVYTTVIVDSYTTVCPVTMTQTSEGVTSVLTTSTISTVYSSSTITATKTVVVKPSGSSPSESAQVTGPAVSSPGFSSETVYTTVIVDSYTTICPVTLTQTNGGTTSVLTTSSTSTVYSSSTATGTRTITVAPSATSDSEGASVVPPGSAQVTGPAVSSPVQSSETVYTTVIVDSYTTICPVTLTQTTGGATSVLTTSSISTVYSTSTLVRTSTVVATPVASAPASSAPAASTPVISSPAQSSETVYTTVVVDSYTTVCPVTLTHTSQGTTSFETTTSLSTVYSTSTLVRTSTVVATPAPSSTGPADACSETCTTEYNTCRSASGANRATCASDYASCLGYFPFDSNGSLVTPTACSSAPESSAPVASAPASSAPAVSQGVSTKQIYSTVSVQSYVTVYPVTLTQTNGGVTSHETRTSYATIFHSSTIYATRTVVVQTQGTSSPSGSVVVPQGSAQASGPAPSSTFGNSGVTAPSPAASVVSSNSVPAPVASTPASTKTGSNSGNGSPSVVASLSATTGSPSSAINTNSGDMVYSTVTVVPVASQAVSSAQGLTTPAPATGSSQPLTSAIGVSGTAGSEECAQPSVITISASPSILTVTQSASVITIIQTAGASSSSGVAYPGSPEKSTVSGVPGKAVSVSSAEGITIASSTMIVPGSGASSTIVVPGAILPTGSEVYPVGSSTVVVPGVVAPTGSVGSSTNSISGTYASGTGINKPTHPASSVTGITAASGSATASPSMIVTGSASRSSISMGLIAVIMGAVALL
ncbi:hypothetical protein EAF00_000999 [Botryotinia globosa]|nr:hypothetical protein EAF00_000999 [Botryotinia globosa]